jgi:hypothetical protein
MECVIAALVCFIQLYYYYLFVCFFCFVFCFYGYNYVHQKKKTYTIKEKLDIIDSVKQDESKASLVFLKEHFMVG